jgi:lipopolysaccharide transport system permease protein
MALMMTKLEYIVIVIFKFAFRLCKMDHRILPHIIQLEFFVVLVIHVPVRAPFYFIDVQFIWKVIMQIGFFATPIYTP